MKLKLLYGIGVAVLLASFALSQGKTSVGSDPIPPIPPTPGLSK